METNRTTSKFKSLFIFTKQLLNLSLYLSVFMETNSSKFKSLFMESNSLRKAILA